MSDIGSKEAVVHLWLALAEGLDYPHPDMVRSSISNSLLRHLALADDKGSTWEEIMTWMESVPSEKERLRQLRRDYYQVFLKADSPLSAYLHDWFPETPPQKFLGNWQQFLDSVQMKGSSGWRNGIDHLSLVFEVLGHLNLVGHPQLPHLKAYIRPWLGQFTEQLARTSRSGFYSAVSGISRKLQNDVEAFR